MAQEELNWNACGYCIHFCSFVGNFAAGHTPSIDNRSFCYYCCNRQLWISIAKGKGFSPYNAVEGEAYDFFCEENVANHVHWKNQSCSNIHDE